jgi:pilus assembly protein CpaC
MKNFIHKFTAFLLMVFVATGFSWTASGAQNSLNKTVELTAGAASTVDLGRPVADLLVANPAIADVGTLRSSRIYVVGKAVGQTNVLAFDDQGNQLADIAVHVNMDESSLRSTLKRFFPKEKIEARTVKNDIILTGSVSTPAVANQVRDLAGRSVATQGQTIVDLMKVQGEQQVMLKVKIVEAKRSALREYGFETDYNALNGAATSGAHFNATGGQTGLASLAPFAMGSLFISDKHFGPLKAAIAALEKNGLINTLAEPSLTAISGETAGFLAGGEFPVPTGRDSNGNITIEFKQFGVSLNFTPTVLASDRISLQLSTEVSAKSDNDGVTLVNTIIPGLTTRKAETTVQMSSGGTIMIAGLLKSEDVHSLSGFPAAQDLPIIGELFKSKSFSRDESELVIMVTPYLVEPYAEQQAEQVSDTDDRAPAPSPAVHASVPAVAAPSALPPQRVGAVSATPILAEVKTREVSPLSQAFTDNLKRVYGAKALQQASGQASFGYIVD